VSLAVKPDPAKVTTAVLVDASNDGVSEVTVVVGAWKANLQVGASTHVASKEAARKRITSAV